MADGSGRTDLLCKVCTGQTSFPTCVFILIPFVTCLAVRIRSPSFDHKARRSPADESPCNEWARRVRKKVVVVGKAEKIVRIGECSLPPGIEPVLQQ